MNGEGIETPFRALDVTCGPDKRMGTQSGLCVCSRLELNSSHDSEHQEKKNAHKVGPRHVRPKGSKFNPQNCSAGFFSNPGNIGKLTPPPYLAKNDKQQVETSAMKSQRMQ